MAADDISGIRNLISSWYQSISETPIGMYQADRLNDRVMSLIDSEDAASPG